MKVLELLEEELPKYIEEVKLKHSENAKAVAFSSFIQKVFDIESKDLDFEVPIKTEVLEMRGRIDAVFGNLIIEFKKDLLKSLEEAKDELEKYFQAFKERYSDANYLGIANDGIRFQVYQPIFEDKKIKEIEKIDEINLENSSPRDVFLWFDSYFFTSEKIIPTSDDLKKRFGLDSPTFSAMRRQLEELFNKVFEYRPVKVKYDSWARYLEIVYGDKPNEKKLFFKHTYLSTFVKLLVHIKLTKNSQRQNHSIVPILFGDTFTQYGINNFLEEDFFTWIMFVTIRKQASKIFEKLLDELYVYDLDKIDEDVLKELYQELVDPDVRKLLGEFYTPDWLAEKMIDESLQKNPLSSVMDPSCGSGTFLFKTIRYKIDRLKKDRLSNSEILNHIVENVIGFDVHPLAAIISKTNYLLALRDLLSSKTGSISIPVFLSDSLKVPTKKMDVALGVTLFEYTALDKKFVFPVDIAKNMQKMDQVIDSLRTHGIEFEKIYDRKYESSYVDNTVIDGAYENLVQSFKRSLVKVVSKSELIILEQNVKTLFDLIKEESNSIWTYVLRNMYKPIAVSYRKVDLLIGNPPWLGLNNMKNEEYQDYLRERSKHYLLTEKRKSQNISNLNLATLFFVQCVDQYLDNKGKISFVMPQGILFASQHANFLKFEKIPIKLTQIYDLEKVTPLFRILSCVIFGTKGSTTEYPITSYDVSGNLPSNNSNLETAKSVLTFKKLEYSPVERKEEKSFYYDRFSQGAQIIPRCFWFVDLLSDSFLGFNPEKPLVESSENKDAKHPWDKIRLKGNVEKQFLSTSILSKDVVPFGNLPRRVIVVPLLMDEHNVKLLDNSQQIEISGLSISKYLEDAEKKWEKNAPVKSRKNMTIYDRIDYQKDLSSQNPFQGYTVLYVKSATYLASCVIENNEISLIPVGENSLKIKGFFAEGTTYFFTTDSKEEAYYLCSIFNSKTLDEKIKPFQSRGMFGGARDIHKLPLSFNILKYDSSNKIHKLLSDEGIKCAKTVKQNLSGLSTKSSGQLRKKIRTMLEKELDIINEKSKQLLK